MPSTAERFNGVRWRLRAMRRLWSPGAQPQWQFLAPEPVEPATAGKIDAPGAQATLLRDLNVIAGWAVFPSGPTSRVEFRLGDTSLGRARLGMPRHDVGDHIDDPKGAVSGFDLTVDLNDWPGPDGPTILRGLATGTAGERLELGPVEVWVGEGGPKPPAKLPWRNKLKFPPPAAVTPPPSAERSGPRTLFFTHQLDVGGAQLYLIELLETMLEQDLVNPTVVSAGDGILRRRLEAMGVPVHICGLLSVEDPSAHIGHLEELVAWAADRDFEAVFVNTATAFSFPGAELADALGIPAIWSIHESFKPSILWGHFEPTVKDRAEAVLGRANLAMFVAEATQHLYEDSVGAEHCTTVPYGFDFSPIERARAELDGATERRKAKIPADADVVLCVGTVEPRKRQVPLAKAFDMVAARHPRARLAIVGTREDEYSELLEHWVEASEFSDRVHLLPITPEIQTWFSLADILVCASDIESLPRTVVEAMAWEMPVLATDVFGLPEIVLDGETGWLCETRDTNALAEGLDRALASSAEERSRMGARAREMIVSRHSLPDYGRTVAELIEKAAAEGPRADG